MPCIDIGSRFMPCRLQIHTYIYIIFSVEEGKTTCCIQKDGGHKLSKSVHYLTNITLQAAEPSGVYKHLFVRTKAIPCILFKLLYRVGIHKINPVIWQAVYSIHRHSQLNLWRYSCAECVYTVWRP